MLRAGECCIEFFISYSIPLLFVFYPLIAMPTISVIVPIYNVERYLSRCLDSLLAQTFGDWEAICVNDGSKDSSSLILQQYAQKDARFVPINKSNGGLSDARNVGLEHATGTYVVYLDSDDFIHPQAFELSLALARTYNADMVTWYKDPIYRPLLIVLHKLGVNVTRIKPRSYFRSYTLDRVMQNAITTDDIYQHLTERSHSGIPHPIKHFYVWRILYRRSLLEGMKFLKRVNFEDFPFMSELMLRMPRVTITQLPFQYYFPNFGSIDLSSGRAKKIGHWLSGLEHIYPLYKKEASSYQMEQWQRNCMWPVVQFSIVRHLKDVKDSAQLRLFAQRLQALYAMGAFESSCDKEAYQCKLKIEQFLAFHDLKF